MTYDTLAERAGLSKGAVHAALQGEQDIAVEVFGTLCRALALGPARLIGEAVETAEAAPPPDPVLPTPPDGYRLAARRGSSRGAALRARLDEVGRSRRTTTGGGRRE